MILPSAFGLYLKDKRKQAGLTQEKLANAIGRTGQYIYNIEKGINNAPVKQSALEQMVLALGLNESDTQKFFETAAADRGTLPQEQIAYISSHHSLAKLIRMGTETDLSDLRWNKVLKEIKEEAVKNSLPN